MKIAVVPGSFDPMTLGHRYIVERALKMFDRVTVALMINPDKQYTFTTEERLEIARLTLSGLDRVSVVYSDGYLADFCAEIGACAIVKGIRNSRDLKYENKMEKFNTSRNPDAVTVYLPAADRLKSVSSTKVRAALDAGLRTEKGPGKYMAPDAVAYINSLGKKSDGAVKNAN